MEQVAVVGLGAMGLPIAQRLAEQLPVAVFDVAADRMSAAAAAGAGIAATAADAARRSDVVLIVVRTLAQAQDALFGPGGAASGLRPGAVVVLTSTVGTAGARGLARQLSEYRAELLDMPMSGGPARARRGDLLVMIGGSDRAVAAARPVIDLLAGTAARVGQQPGDGQAMKTVNQLLCGVHIAAAAEALALARALGLDPAAALQTLGAGAASSFMLADRGPRIAQALAGQPSGVNSRADIFVKDMGIVLDAGTSAGIALPVAGAAHQLYLLARAAGLAAADDSAVATLLSPAAPDGA
ncbi:MAG TPA: NAD(P)-dependent oxidoreductase [Streptosporangiaceae bacterium]|nr:NAD(P)-dependent oxidoreductase [Streptosporangiaceae bacterium]